MPYNLSAGEVEAGRSLELTDQDSQSNWQEPGHSERSCLKNKRVARNKMRKH